MSSERDKLIDFCQSLDGNSLFHKVIWMLRDEAIKDMLCASLDELPQKQAEANAPDLLAAAITRIGKGKLRGHID